MEFVATARFDPSSPGAVADPTINEPPWILVLVISFDGIVVECRTYQRRVGSELLGAGDEGT